MTLNCIHIFIVTGSSLYWCAMRPTNQHFFIHSCIYLRILIISCSTSTILGSNGLNSTDVPLSKKQTNVTSVLQSSWKTIIIIFVYDDDDDDDDDGFPVSSILSTSLSAKPKWGATQQKQYRIMFWLFWVSWILDYYKWRSTLDFAYKFNTKSEVMCVMSEY